MTMHISSSLCRELPAEALPADDTGPTVNPDELIDLQQPELLEERWHIGTEEVIEILEWLQEDATGQTEEPEMREDVDQNVDPEQSEVVDNNEEEQSIEAADNAERKENSSERVELTEKLEGTSCLEQPDCEQITPQDVELPPQPVDPESQQLEMTEEVELSQDSDQLGEHLDQSPEMELTEEESAQPEAEEDSTQSEQTVGVEAEDPSVAERQEQTEPPEQNEQTLQTTDSSQPTLSEQQLVQPETDESDITEHLSPETEVTRPTEEFNQVDKQAETSQRGEEGGPEDGSVQTVVANGERPEPPETAAPHMNGDDVNREMARRLAERLFKLDGIQRVDVVKHLDKE